MLQLGGLFPLQGIGDPVLVDPVLYYTGYPGISAAEMAAYCQPLVWLLISELGLDQHYLDQTHRFSVIHRV